ncbi:hypothetical protein AMAG_11224 [Allomyces macrogynus ATCC 38327]|uniref:Glutamine amidotransferase type-2 domain-containing protein n=1 Tax=Allomyces macrogynus (strain ATCC 38327) TaxID=578462 RepID=A0A0L0SW78_ALLM3|nr:hypothetical protein AMAG_11224 [Allomyces macrogynus ATCC 38327]|eukprot:KNE66726.1 hypothetical protein AMAG_11224 [Allomyces macrogynus ATCC 38327]
MCGIAAQFVRSPTNSTAQLAATQHGQELASQATENASPSLAPQVDPSWIKHRGPNHFGLVEVVVASEHRGADAATKSNGTAAAVQESAENSHIKDGSLQLIASVLHLRGEKMVEQPVRFHGTGDNELILCWNGEVYAGMGTGTDLAAQSDTAYLIRQLSEIDVCSRTAADFGAGIVALFEDLEAEFAMILFNARFKTLWYGRDCLGRRSLLHHHAADTLALSSVHLPGCPEVPVGGLWSVDLSAPSLVDSRVQWPWSRFHKDTRLNLVVPSDLAAQVPINPADFPALNDLDSAHAATVTNLLGLLSESVRMRAQALPTPSTPTNAPLAVLFSGGLDCTILAALLDQHVPRTSPIHLLNVAFENPRVLTASKRGSGTNDPWAVPDRRTARQALAELQRVAPTRTWRLLEINVPYAVAMAHRATIAALMAPLDTVMDMSIAMAFYFAARAVHEDGEVACAAPVLFSGLGADELVGGYGRHRVQWEKGGWTSLGEELQLEVDRIASRNLGRDDRIVSHFGKEVRFPYLDKRVVTFLTALPVHWKCDPRYGKGIGDKILLRLVARELGLEVTAKEAKRAVQFGSRTAKMELGTRNVTGTMKVEVRGEQ